MNNDNNIQAELEELGFTLGHLKTPDLSVPKDYLDQLNGQVFDEIAIAEISDNWSKQMPQQISSEYFDQFNSKVLTKVATETPTVLIGHPTKKYHWAMAASIALILSVGLFLFQGSDNNSFEAQLSGIEQAELNDYMQSHAYDFNDYILDGQADLQQVEADFLHEVEGLSKDEIMEYAL